MTKSSRLMEPTRQSDDKRLHQRPNANAVAGQSFPLFWVIFPLLLFICGGCQTFGTTIGAVVGSGHGISISANQDFLYSGNGEAHSNNRRGLDALLKKNYFAAHQFFQSTLDLYPNNPDATYYLGLTMIYEGKRDAGFDLLMQYKDALNIRIQQEVRWWANYCRKQTAFTPEKIHTVMNNARYEGYQREREDEWDRRNSLFD
ncbi:conserved protein of unknown function [Pseudodesulfovibrio piezophilus C1TLV30]|uniref:Tetratricopeptide repeat protein n=2 Tax=Pseudodesulfovibrio TaxID=2035811 RepID=M1WKZ8_PSEP2|nr:conserved protein of unknown function [Pseudodesulfovibrio piezophilus C1TLV30]